MTNITWTVAFSRYNNEQRGTSNKTEVQRRESGLQASPHDSLKCVNVLCARAHTHMMKELLICLLKKKIFKEIGEFTEDKNSRTRETSSVHKLQESHEGDGEVGGFFGYHFSSYFFSFPF